MKSNHLLLVLAFLHGTQAQKCYFPSGEQAPDKYKPCGSKNTTYSTCCSSDQDDQCLRNGLCSWSSHYDYRAACTDENWSGCQEVCPNQKNNTWIQVKECASNEYCCNLNSSTDCCKSGAARFSLKSPKVTASTSSSNEPSSSSTPIGAIVGGVVGGVIVIAALLGLGWWLIRRKRRAGLAATTHGKDEGDKLPAETSPGTENSLLEADAGPETVLVESDARQIQPRILHELAA